MLQESASTQLWGGLGDEHGDGLVFVDPAEGDFLAGHDDHAGVAGAALHPDGVRWMAAVVALRAAARGVA